MRIERLSSKPDRAGRYLVRFEDGTVLRLYRQTAEDYGLYAGLDLSGEQMENLRRDAGAMSAKMRAVRIVSASNVSKKDLQQRLERKGENPQQAREAVEWMSELRLLEDRETARQIVSRCAGRGYGLARAKQALYEKKIPREYWEEALADYPDQTDAILAFLKAKLTAESDERDVKRATDALLRRGHQYGEIRKALQQMQLDSENDLED